MKKIIILLLTLFLTCSCSNYHEIETLGIVSSMYINYTNNNYNIIIELYKDKKYTTLNTNGLTLSDALNNITNKNSYLFYNHLKYIIINKNVNLNNIMEYFSRSTYINNNFKILISNEDIELNKDINDLINNNVSNKYNFINILKNYYNESPYLIPIFNTNINEYYILKKDNIITSIDNNLYKIISLLNKDNNNIFNIDNNFIIDTNKIKINTNIIDIECSLKELNIDIDTTNINNIILLENNTNEYISNQINNLNNYLNTYNIDTYNKYNNYKINTHINKKGLRLK